MKAFTQEMQASGLQADTSSTKLQGLSTTGVANLTALESKAASMNASLDWAKLGASIDAGLAGGITSNTALVTGAVTAALNQGLAAAKTHLGAHSPSQVAAAQIGLPFMQGIALGITSNLGLVTTAIAGVTNSAMASGALSGSVSLATTASNSVGSSLASLDAGGMQPIGSESNGGATAGPAIGTYAPTVTINGTGLTAAQVTTAIQNALEADHQELIRTLQAA
jgi:hypothetical protein